MSEDNIDNIALSYYVDDINDESTDSEKDQFKVLDYDKLMAEIDNIDLDDSNVIPQMLNYRENYTSKELFVICDYYGFGKQIKTNKLSKEEVIQCIVTFESAPENAEIVFRRQNLWFYINELKRDKYMKKFVYWN